MNNLDQPSWVAKGPWGAGTVTAVAVDPNNNDIIYMGLLNRGIYKSTDGGDSWASSSTGLVSDDDTFATFNNQLTVLTIVFDPLDSLIIYVGLQYNGVYKSSNAGLTWQAVPYQVNPYSTYSFQNMVISPKQRNIIFAIISIPLGGLVLKSEDYGVTWQIQLNAQGIELGPITPAEFSFESIAMSPLDDHVVYVGGSELIPVYKTENGGQSWQASGLEDLYVVALACDLDEPNTVYAGTLSGMYRSIDGGNNWQATNNGIDVTNILDLWVNPAQTDEIFAATPAGVYRSLDKGMNWSLTSLKDHSVITLSGGNNQICAGTGIPGINFGDPTHAPIASEKANVEGLFLSHDKGEQWSNIADQQLPAFSPIYKMFMDPKDPKIIYLIVSEEQLVVTYDGGIEWSVILAYGVDQDTNSLMVDLVIDPENPETIYLATFFGDVFKSADRGKSWAKNARPIDQDYDFNCMTIDAEGSLYVGTQLNGVLKSKDDGKSWQQLGVQPPQEASSVLLFHIDPSDAETIYILTTGQQLYVSKDAGNQWQALDVGYAVYAFAVDPSDSDTIYAGIGIGGVMLSFDGGSSWDNQSIGLPSRTCTDIIVHSNRQADPAVSTIYASFGFDGVFTSQSIYINCNVPIHEGLSWSGLNDLSMTAPVVSLGVNQENIVAGTENAGVFFRKIN